MFKKTIIFFSLFLFLPPQGKANWLFWDDVSLIKTPPGEKTVDSVKEIFPYIATLPGEKDFSIKKKTFRIKFVFLMKQNKIHTILGEEEFFLLPQNLKNSIALTLRDIFSGKSSVRFPPAEKITLNGRKADFVQAKIIDLVKKQGSSESKSSGVKPQKNDSQRKYKLKAFLTKIKTGQRLEFHFWRLPYKNKSFLPFWAAVSNISDKRMLELLKKSKKLSIRQFHYKKRGIFIVTSGYE